MEKPERVQVDRRMGNVAQGKDVRRFAQKGCLAGSHRARNDKQRFRNRSICCSIMPWVQSCCDGVTLKLRHHPRFAQVRDSLDKLAKPRATKPNCSRSAEAEPHHPPELR